MKSFCAVLVMVLIAAAVALPACAEDAVIKPGSKVAFDYVLTVDGIIADTSQAKGPLEYTQGEGNLPVGLMRQMEGMKAGDEKTIEVKPEEGYGNPDPSGIKEIPLSQIPKEIKPEVGIVLQMQDQSGQLFPARITAVKPDSITIDLNHPLAGKTMVFKVRVVSVK